jgi:homospermidine synthase
MLPEAKVERLKSKIEKLKDEIVRLNAINAEMMKSEDKQVSLTDPDARSMATSGKDTGIVGYNVRIAVDTQHHLIVAHEVTNVGTDRHQLANIFQRLGYRGLHLPDPVEPSGQPVAPATQRLLCSLRRPREVGRQRALDPLDDVEAR